MLSGFQITQILEKRKTPLPEGSSIKMQTITKIEFVHIFLLKAIANGAQGINLLR